MYLKNSICNFTPLFEIDYSKKKNLVCGSLFKITGGGYKDLSVYVEPFKNTVEKLLKKMPDLNLKFRLFIERSIFEDKKLYGMLEKLKNVEMVLYECPNYIIEDVHHRGIFGMIVRFFPLFDFENNDADTVIISDLDVVDDEMTEIFNYYNKIIDRSKEEGIFEDLYFAYHSHTNFRGNFWSRNGDIFINNKIIPYYVSMRLICFKRLNKSSIINYIENAKEYRDLVWYSYDRGTEWSRTRLKKSNDSYMFYGWDEYFLNSLFIKDNIDVPFGCLIYFAITENIWALQRKMELKKELWRGKYLSRFFSYIFGKNKLGSFDDKFRSYYKLFFKKMTLKTKLSGYMIFILTRIYKFYIINYNDNELIDCMFRDYINIILSDYYLGKVIYYEDKFHNTKLDSINVNFIELPKDKVKELKKLKEEHNLPKVLY